MAFGAMAGAALALGVGILAKNDTYCLAIVTIIPVYTILKFHWWIKTSERPLTFCGGAALVAAVGLPLLLVSAIPLAALLSIRPDDFSKDDSPEASQKADLCFGPWKEPVDRGIKSCLLRLDPGPHLAIPTSTLEARMGTSPGQPIVENHPETGQAANFEAHNTVRDLFTQGGLFLAIYQFRPAGVTALLVGLIAFATTHLSVRLPIFWFAVALCPVPGTKPGEPPTIMNRS